MAGAIRCANLQPTFISTPSLLRRGSPLLPASQPPFLVGRSIAAPLIWKLRSVSRVGRITASSDSSQGIGNGENRLPQVSNSNWSTVLVKFAVDNFLPLALVSGVVIGFANPSIGCLADTYYLSKFSTFGIFTISGLMLRSEEIGAAAEAWPVGLLGLASILFFTPLFSKIITLLKLQPQEFVTGLAIFSCMPTTLSSGVALTRLAGGNSALALAMTVISSLLGIVIIPFSVSKFVAAGVGLSVPSDRLLRSLSVTLLLPLVLGKIAREVFEGVADFADGNRKLLGMISAVLLSLVPWIQVSRSRSLLLMVKPAIFLVAVLMGAFLHVALFAFNALLIRSLFVISGGSNSTFAKKENVRALLLVASQKTLPVMVAVAEQLHGALGETGLLVLPCVAAHLNQIIIDSFIVSHWKQQDLGFESAKVA